MECRTNEAGYLALKRLNESGDLLFELKDLVNDLLKVCFPLSSFKDKNDSYISFAALPEDPLDYQHEHSSYHTITLPRLLSNLQLVVCQTCHVDHSVLHRSGYWDILH